MPKLHILGITLASTLGLLAGPVNVANLSQGDIFKFTIATGDASQDFILSFGQTSGTFFLPDEKATLTAETPGKTSVELPPNEQARLAIFRKMDEKHEFLIVDSKPTPEKWTFRIINLTEEAINLQHKNQVLEVKAGKESAVDVRSKNDIYLVTPDETRHTLPEHETEPTAALAVILPTEDGHTVIFIMDR